MRLSVFVPGTPSAQGSKRSVGNGRMVDMNKNLQPWRDSITWAVRNARPADAPEGPLFTGPVSVRLTAVYPRPKSHYRTGKHASELRDDAPFYKVSAPDTDKVARAACDAITASGVWRDDAQVAVLYAIKEYGKTPGLAVTIEGLL